VEKWTPAVRNTWNHACEEGKAPPTLSYLITALMWTPVDLAGGSSMIHMEIIPHFDHVSGKDWNAFSNPPSFSYSKSRRDRTAVSWDSKSSYVIPTEWCCKACHKKLYKVGHTRAHISLPCLPSLCSDAVADDPQRPTVRRSATRCRRHLYTLS
jgi:hypothetical protein